MSRFPGPGGEVLPREAFHNLLRNERRRADRDGSAFCLLVFEMSAEAPAVRSRVADLLLGRARSIDAVGWLDGNCLALFLPATPLQGAWRLAARLEEEMIDRFEPPPFTVYSYPHHWYETWERPAGPGTAPLGGAAADGSGPGSPEAGGPEAGGPGAWPGGPRHRGGDDLDDRMRARLGRLLAGPIPLWKRLLDAAIALPVLLLLSPLLLVIGLTVWIVSPGPVIFRQARVGHGGMLFDFLKFRTMKVGSSSSAHQSHLAELICSDRPMEKLDQGRDDRLIPGGRFLRRTSLDELPQLINVLRGEMSLVGPRPCIPYEAREYQRWHTQRFDILPGMTGLWQVSGKNHLTFQQMIRLDIAYGRRMSPGLDLIILLRTVPTLLVLAFEKTGSNEKDAERSATKRSICETLAAIAEKYPKGGRDYA